jgi:hypothetical protein
LLSRSRHPAAAAVPAYAMGDPNRKVTSSEAIEKVGAWTVKTKPATSKTGRGATNKPVHEKVARGRRSMFTIVHKTT